jgi:hypothetical protein
MGKVEAQAHFLAAGFGSEAIRWSLDAGTSDEYERLLEPWLSKV